MKGFLLLFVLAYAGADKLDLTYLPPPGSQYSGGRPEDIQVPLEFPKETYSTTFNPQTTPISLEEFKPEDYQATIGINRGLPPQNLNIGPRGQLGSVSNLQNPYKVPTTTVSYAFTQTTTHPPSESFETTISPLNTATGFPVTSLLNEPTFQPGLFYEQNINKQNRPGDAGYEVVDQFGLLQPTNVPYLGNIAQFPSSPAQSQQSVFDQNRSGQPGFSPFNRPSFQGSGSLNEQNINTQNRPDQLGESQPTDAPRPGSITQFSGSPAQSQVPVYDQNHPVQPQPNSFNQFLQGNKQPSSHAPGLVSQTPFVQNQYSGNQTVLENISPQRIQTNLQPGIASVVGENVNGPQGFPNVQPNIPQGGFIEQQYGQAGIPTSSTQIPPVRQQNTGRYATQQYPGYSDSNDDSRDGVLQNKFRPTTTIAPIGSSTSIPDQEYSTGPSVSANGYYSTPAYPGASQGNVAPTRYRNRPERPQAESDRNAVILNYDNVITPDGYFAYSYDTSNGIHADESGDANDGVKAKGSYSYTGDDGKVYTVVYTADENGFRPQGSHLPTPPPVPEAIQKIIDKVKQEKEAGITHDGFYDENKYGHKKLKDSTTRRPQTSSVGILNSNDPSFNNELGQPNVNRQYGTQEGPISTTNDYNTLKQQDEQDYYDESDNFPKRINQYSPLRQSGLNTNLQDTTSTKQPLNTERKQYQQENSPNNRNQENIRRPISIPTSSLANGLQHQNVEQTMFAEPTESQNQGNIRDYIDHGNTRGSNIQGPSRRPITEIDTQNRNNEFDSGKGNIDRPGSRPFDRLNNLSPFEKVSIENAKQSSGKIPLSDDSNEDLPKRDQYRFGENLTKQQSLKNRPGNRMRPEKEPQTYVGQTVSSSRRPGQGGFLVSKPGMKIVNSENIPEADELPEEDSKADYVPANGFRKISGNKQSPITSNGEEKVAEQLLPENIQQKVISQQPKIGSITSIDRQRQKQVPVQSNRFSNLDNTSVNVPSFNRQDSNGRPSFIQRTGISRNNNLPQVKETGYQYIPPQTKFNQDEKNPFRLTGTDYTSTTRKPSQFSFYDTKDATAKPFITPNVSRVDKNNSGEDYDEEQFTPGKTDLPQNNIKQNYGEKYNTARIPQYAQTGTTPDQVSDDEIISPTRLPNYSTTAGSTYRPTFDRTTGKPTQQYNSIPTYNNVAKGTINPYPSEDDRYHDQNEFNTKSPYNFVTSTTPIPSRTGYYGSTQPDTLVPGSETYFNRKTNRPVQPDNGFVSSTTPIPQGSRFDGTYPQNVETQYQKTYSPLDNIRPTTEYYDRTVGSRLPSRPIGSTTTNAPFDYTQAMKYGDRLPSSTYGPVDRNQQLSSTPSSQFDRFGRPINNYQQGGVGDQYQTGPSRDIQSRPVYEDNSRGQIQPNNNPKGYNPQSSTERVIGEDFSGPKQSQYFDSKTGYHYK